MNRFLPVLLVSLLALCGCAQHYVITLNNGREMTVAGKPKLKNGSYCFKDAAGQMQFVPEGRVRTIEPASMAKQEAKQFAPKPPKAKKPRHWYFLWLA